jgi:hypothetical protein
VIRSAIARWCGVFVRKPPAPQKPEWHGRYLDENGIVADVLSHVLADVEAVMRWRDPASWQLFGNWWRCRRHGLAFSAHEGCAKCIMAGETCPAESHAPPHAGCLTFAGQGIRNWYGLWHPENPHTRPLDDYEATSGVITDPRHPDNLSGRVIGRVRAALDFYK